MSTPDVPNLAFPEPNYASRGCIDHFPQGCCVRTARPAHRHPSRLPGLPRQETHLQQPKRSVSLLGKLQLTICCSTTTAGVWFECDSDFLTPQNVERWPVRGKLGLFKDGSGISSFPLLSYTKVGGVKILFRNTPERSSFNLVIRHKLLRYSNAVCFTTKSQMD